MMSLELMASLCGYPGQTPPVSRSMQLTDVGFEWWKNVYTFVPTRIGTWPSPPVPWLIGGNGGGRAFVVASPSSAVDPATRLSPLPDGVAVHPGAVVTDAGSRVCSPLSVTGTVGRLSVAHCWGSEPGRPFAPMDHVAESPCAIDAPPPTVALPVATPSK